MAEAGLTSTDFERIEQSAAIQAITRPSLSYWQDAWIRLKDNRRALYSLYLIIALLMFTIAGPWVWRIDPGAQDVDQISQPPGTDRKATVVEPFVPWDGTTLIDTGTGLRLAQPATTQAVRIQWDPLTSTGTYRVYRNIFPLGEERAFGLPLAEVSGSDGLYFEDRLDLRPGTYHYAVVVLDEFGGPGERFETLEVELTRVITVYEALAKGLVASTNDIRIGDEVKLALHPFGTDYLGRDMLARLMAGAGVSLFIGIFAPFLYVLLGVVYGATAGFIGGRTDQGLMRFADFVVALPFLLFMILFKIVFGIGPGESGIMPMLLALVILAWPATARLVRGQILQIREEGYISACRLLGAKTTYLVVRHMIPNTMGVILVTLTFAVPSAIFTEAFLSFIGMGVAPPTPSWGSMCNEGLKTMLTYPHELVFPALFISITVLAFNLLGDGLRDALDARMRSRE
ncbi:MAG: ABC transporter permease [Pseudomonadales bacterium]|jgi:oligopeptide transport system permease protein|nr:ABC transporter permease [Pseudomonadales bacterium]MDP6470237.1 ABC transporter permease [Pseudomonadales bacterium]MDP6827143.1 ABC transporter permease [Pseudomonadales bacterium]MDP6971765.1 ABC transporter permease [Pseudomonadales bacterium]